MNLNTNQSTTHKKTWWINTFLETIKSSLSKMETMFIRLSFTSILLFIVRIGFDVPPWVDLSSHFLNVIIILFFCLYSVLKLYFSTSKWAYLKQYRFTYILFSIFFIDVVLVLFAVTEQSYARFLLQPQETTFFYVISAVTQVFVLLALVSGQFTFTDFFHQTTISPPRLFVTSFVIIILAGTTLLLLPNSTTHGISVIDALFTATSAVCVTGLVVLDTATDFTRTGQTIILLLIQTGGLGIITFTAFFAYVGGQRGRLKYSILVKELIQSDYISSINRLLRRIILSTLIIELIGALILYALWTDFQFNSSETLYEAIFFSISAFCNAGFAVYSDSFMTHHNDVLSLGTISFLIILGSIGAMAIAEVRRYIFTNTLNRKLKKVSIQTRLILNTTAVLLSAGTLLFFISEYHYSMEGLGFFEKLKASFFQSVVARTAGFNSVDFSAFSLTTTLWYLPLMFIGGASGSTSGGIKVNTVSVLWLWVKHLFQNKTECIVYGRSLPIRVFHQAIIIFCVAVVYVLVAIILLSLTETVEFSKLIFEVVSAFATVGVSQGVTAHLSFFGKLIISFTMLVGRVGIISFALSFIERREPPIAHVKYPEEQISVG